MKRVVASFLTALVALPMALPQMAQARAFAHSANYWRNFIANSSPQQKTIDPFDEQANTLLQSLGLTVQVTDPLWQDPTFVAFVDAYNQANTAMEQQDVKTGMQHFFDFLYFGSQINREDFQTVFGPASEVQQYFGALKSYLADHQAEYDQDPRGTITTWSTKFVMDAYQQAAPQTEAADALALVEGYTDTTTVNPGQVVWLHTKMNGLAGVTVTWNLVSTSADVTYRPLTTASPTDYAFIAPQVGADTTMVFEMTAADSTHSVSNQVTLTVKAPQYGNDPVALLYRTVLGRNPDMSGYQYWTEQYKHGTNLKDIEKTFRASDEYKHLHK